MFHIDGYESISGTTASRRKIGIRQESRFRRDREKNMQKTPSHIPPRLVSDNSLSAFMRELDDPWLAGARPHGGPDVIWATDAAYGKPGWIITRHTPMQEALKDHERFTSQAHGDVANLLGVAWRLNPIEFDPPAHSKYGHILNPFFAPKSVASCIHGGKVFGGTRERSLHHELNEAFAMLP
jgi:hypothetical protein